MSSSPFFDIVLYFIGGSIALTVVGATIHMVVNMYLSQFYWKINKDGRIVALQSFSIRPDTYGFDVIKGQIGAMIPKETTLPKRTEKFWVDISSHIGSNCSFGSDVLIDRDCRLDSAKIGNMCDVRRGVTITDSTLEYGVEVGCDSVITRSLIGKCVLVQSDVTIDNSVLRAHVNALADSTIMHSNILDNSTVGAACQLTNCVVIERVRVAPNIKADNIVIPCSIPYTGQPSETPLVLDGAFIQINTNRSNLLIYKLGSEYYVGTGYRSDQMSYRLGEMDQSMIAMYDEETIEQFNFWKQKLLQGEQ